jgi:hypothetical protein
VITLEGDSVVIVEGPGMSPPEETEEEENEEPPAAAALNKSRAARESLQREALSAPESPDDEVRREIESAFAADPTTRAEFILPSGKRLSLNEPQTEVDADAAAEAATLLEQSTRRERKLGRAWMAGSIVLALLLVMQMVHHNRQSLVRTAVLGPMLTHVYAGFGSELTPEWNVHAYQLRQWGAAADPGAHGTLRVRASLMNGAQHAQPYPLLRLTLQDRFGERVGLRDLEPSEYLASPAPENRLLGAGQRIDAEIAIVDPGKDAVGFEIDVCLRQAASITCANDASRQTG